MESLCSLAKGIIICLVSVFALFGVGSFLGMLKTGQTDDEEPSYEDNDKEDSEY